MMFDEHCDGKLNLYAVNDTREDKTLAYTVENDCGEIVTSGKAFAKSDTSALVCSIPASEERDTASSAGRTRTEKRASTTTLKTSAA